MKSYELFGIFNSLDDNCCCFMFQLFQFHAFSDCGKMRLPKRSAPYWPNQFLFFWHSGTLPLSPERQSARMSKHKTGLDQYGPERFEV